MDKPNFFLDDSDLQFLIKERCDFEEIFKWVTPEALEMSGASNAEEYKQTWLDVLETIGAVSGGQFAANAEAVDRSHCELKDGEVILPKEIVENLNTLAEIGVCALGVGAEHGGLEAPMLVEMVTAGLVNRACPSTLLNGAWYGVISQIIERFASDALKEKYCPRIATGEWAGSMALTEPDAGSDLASIRAYGEKQEDGSYKLHGTKRFISNGNSQVCLVLAKESKQATGLRSINLFLCPRVDEETSERNYEISKLEEKLGLHGSATCEIQFEGSKAFLIGKPGEGFQYMLHLMNDARVSVGFQALGLMEATYRLAKKYADERVCWGKPIAHHELIAEKLLDLEIELQAFKSILVQAAYHLSLVKAISKYLETSKDLSEIERKKAESTLKKCEKRVRSWTPVIKWWAGEKSFEHARNCLQIHGGYGFSTEYQPEFWLRESVILSLYEGTSQIQALMCVKDTLKDVIRKPKNFMEHYLGVKVRQISKETPLRKKMFKAKEIYDSAVFSVIMQLVKVNVKKNFGNIDRMSPTTLMKNLSKVLGNFENLRPAFLHAERICEMKAIIAQGEAVVRDAESFAEREYIAERFLRKYIPRMNYLKAQIEEECTVLNQRLDSYRLQAEQVKAESKSKAAS